MKKTSMVRKYLPYVLTTMIGIYAASKAGPAIDRATAKIKQGAK